MRAGEEGVGEDGGFAEAGRGFGDVVDGGEQEAGRGFGDRDGREAGWKRANIGGEVAAEGRGKGWGRDDRGGIGGAAFGRRRGVVGQRGGVDAGLVVEEDEDVVEAGLEFVC